MLEQIIENNVIGITISGIFFIFLGLIAIAVVIGIFNLYLNKGKAEKDTKEQESEEEKREVTPISEIPEEELVAIAAALETYRRIHYTEMLTEITFKHGDSRSPWKTSGKFTNKTF